MKVINEVRDRSSHNSLVQKLKAARSAMSTSDNENQRKAAFRDRSLKNKEARDLMEKFVVRDEKGKVVERFSAIVETSPVESVIKDKVISKLLKSKLSDTYLDAIKVKREDADENEKNGDNSYVWLVADDFDWYVVITEGIEDINKVNEFDVSKVSVKEYNSMDDNEKAMVIPCVKGAKPVRGKLLDFEGWLESPNKNNAPENPKQYGLDNQYIPESFCVDDEPVGDIISRFI